MFIVGLMLVFALSLSGAAAYYSIIGLMAIFAASPIPIAVMGSILEGSKLVVASWLYRNWKNVPALMKSYFTLSLVILMFLTSMGIFGYLSKAHLDQGVPTGDIAARVQFIDEQIKTERENINAARQALSQLDDQINKYTELGSVSRGVSVRKQQQEERTALTQQVYDGQAKIAELNRQKAEESKELRKVEAEVGPIKYIAALIYGDEATEDATLLEKAVRWVIILIVVVFDPLAVLMLIAANWSFVHNVKKTPAPIVKEEQVKPKKPRRRRTKKQEPTPSVEMVEVEVEPVVATAVEAVAEANPEVEALSNEHPVFRPSSSYWKKSGDDDAPNPVTKIVDK
jgi:hypothetical protein